MKQEKSNRGRKGYSLDFKWRVIDDLLATGESIATTILHYGITARHFSISFLPRKSDIFSEETKIPHGGPK